MQWHPTASRRQFLTSVVAVGIGSVLPSTEKTLEPQRRSGAANVQIGRIDVHSHVTPPALIRALSAQRLGNVAGWTVEKHLNDMNDAGVSTAVVSIAPAGTPFADPAMAPRLTRESNEYAAQLTRDHPGRFGFFAALPLPNIEASLAEMGTKIWLFSRRK